MLYHLSTDQILQMYPITISNRLANYRASLVAILTSQQLTLDYTNFDKAAQNFAASAQSLELWRTQVTQSQNSNNIVQLNSKLSNVERQFLIPNGGLPKRPWYRHCLQAPGYVLGYGAVSFPGVYDEIQWNDMAQAQIQLNIIANAIQQANSFIYIAGAQTTKPTSKNSNTGIGTWAIISIIFGALVLLLAAAGIVFVVYRKRSQYSRI